MSHMITGHEGCEGPALKSSQQLMVIGFHNINHHDIFMPSTNEAPLMAITEQIYEVAEQGARENCRQNQSRGQVCTIDPFSKNCCTQNCCTAVQQPSSSTMPLTSWLQVTKTGNNASHSNARIYTSRA